MDWKTILILGLIFSGLSILWPRIESSIRIMFLVVLYLPSVLLIVRWTMFREAWGELLISIGIAAGIFLLWWRLYGRNLPPPTGSKIRVLTDFDDE
jgi:hypothetical protein